ncbi:MAG TPA: glycosyltransferase, partial [Candidatus Hydrogenedentes bacterium]|nr:glycosyltransferase [Candidatus Hydrogenedentota bacterium]
VLIRENVSHVHVHFGTNAAAVARLICRLGGPGYSMTVHGPDEFDAAIGLSLGDKIRDAAFVVGVSQFGAAQLRRWIPCDMWDKVHVVHCTVDESWLAPAPPVDAASRTLVCVGRLSAQKGQALLIEAFARMAADGVDARLVLVGDGELRGAIEARIARYGLADRVVITGWQSEVQVRAHVLEARAFVLSSFAEGLPVVIMEALALGRPVISTYIAGIPELVRPGENGWLVPAGDVAALAAVMREALEAPVETLRAMGRAGRDRVAIEHCAETEARKLDMLFRHYLKPGGSAH